jgi:hypothetical protein
MVVLSYTNKELIYASARDLARYLDLVHAGRNPVDEEDADGEVIPDGPLLTAVHEHLSHGQHSEAFAALVPHLGAGGVLGKVQPVDVRYAVRALASLGSLCGRESLSAVADAVAAAAAAGTVERGVALTMLLDMANHCPENADPCRSLALARALDFAAANGLGELVRGEAAAAARRVEEWGMGPGDARVVFRALAAVHPADDALHLQFLVRHLGTFPESEAGGAEVGAIARRAVLCAIAHPAIFRFDDLCVRVGSFFSSFFFGFLGVLFFLRRSCL